MHAEAYKDIPFTGTLTSLSLKKSDEGAGASAIKIDGYVLLDGAIVTIFHLMETHLLEKINQEMEMTLHQ